MSLEEIGKGALSAVLYSAIGIVVFIVALKLCVKLAPFSIRKEIEEDQNVALGIVLGAIFIGLGLIVSAAVHG